MTTGDVPGPATSTCAIVGGGPAGLVLGLLLARGGIQVTVLEKHNDFLRDFRGDTVHPSTMTLIDELGLWQKFATLPWKPMAQFTVELDAGAAIVADLARLRQPHPFIAMVPQWHLLDMLAAAAAMEPTFTLRREAAVTGLVEAGGRVNGVRWSDKSGADHVLQANLVVGCDGRDSIIRNASGLPVHDFAVPMDVWWFRIPRGHDDDPSGGLFRASRGRLAIMLDRGDYYQVAYVLPRGKNAEYRLRPVGWLQDDLHELHPWLGDRVRGITSWDDVKLLTVSLNRLRKWSRPGMLCIGDAAHAMSPVGGVGINLAVQDAVAAARILAPALRASPIDPLAVDRAAGRVQRRRWFPTAISQGIQRIVHHRIVSPALDETVKPEGLPIPMKLLARFPWLRVIPARAVGVGVLPEHAPIFARRSNS